MRPSRLRTASRMLSWGLDQIRVAIINLALTHSVDELKAASWASCDAKTTPADQGSVATMGDLLIMLGVVLNASKVEAEEDAVEALLISQIAPRLRYFQVGPDPCSSPSADITLLLTIGIESVIRGLYKESTRLQYTTQQKEEKWRSWEPAPYILTVLFVRQTMSRVPRNLGVSAAKAMVNSLFLIHKRCEVKYVPMPLSMTH